MTAPDDTRTRTRRRKLGRAAAGIVLIALCVAGYAEARSFLLGRELVREAPDAIPRDATLLAYGTALGRRTYQANCVSCHGADLKGDKTRGVPNLSDDIWLYDFGRISDIERTVLYGIRSGDARAHNITAMPGLGLERAITPGEIKDVMAYVGSLTKGVEDPAAVTRGERIFQDKGVCYDCHGSDGTGSSDYGAPSLVDADTLYGDDAATIYSSIYDGRRGLCPAWIGKLSFPAIRAVAVYLHSMSQEAPFSPDRQAQAPAGGSG